MTDQPRSYTRKAPKRAPRLFKVGSARQALADFDHGMETTAYTFGQFSIIDAVVALLEKVGPADVVIATWTAGAADLTRSAELLQDGRIRSCRWVVDQSFETRQPGYCRTMRKLFGDDCIRTLRSHAKFVLIGNDEWNIVVRTSMNLNENKRLENIDVIDEPDFYAWHLDMVDGIFAREKVGDFRPKGDVDITGVDGMLPFPEIEIGRVYERGHVNVGA